MKNLFSFGVALFSLALSLALVTSGAVVANVAPQIDPPEGIAAPSRLAVIGDDEDDGEGDGVLNLPQTDNDGTDSDGIDTPTPTDNDGTDSDGIDTPAPTDNDGTDSDGIDTPTPTDNDGTDSDGIDTQQTSLLHQVPSMEFDGKATVDFTNVVVPRDLPSKEEAITKEVHTALTVSSAPISERSTSSIFDSDATYRVLTRYGSGTEIDLADYISSETGSAVFTLESCDESRGDYYDSAAVENGKLVMASNTRGHVHGPNTQSETVCTVTATIDGASEDREFRLYTVSDRTPPPMPSGAVTLVEARAGEIDVRVSQPGASSGYLRIGWRKPGEQPTSAVVSGVTSDTVLTIPGLEAETEYEIRVYALSSQGFDLYRGGNTGQPGELIAEGSPPAKWTSNLAGGGLGKSEAVMLNTGNATNATSTPVATPTPVRPPPDDDDDDTDTPTPTPTDNDGTDSDGIDTPTPTDNDGTDSDGIDTPTPTDNDGTDSDGVDTPTPTDNDGTDSDGVDTPTPTDNDGTDSDGIDTPTPTDNDGTDSDGIDTPTPTDNDGTDSDGIDTPTPTDNDGTDSDGIDTPTPTDNDGTDSDGIDTPTPTDNDGTDSDGVDTPTPQSDPPDSDADSDDSDVSS